MDEEHKEVIENVLQYVCHSKEKLAQLSSAIPGGDQRHLHLFTAALMAGVSLADHQALFSPLVEALKSSATPHLATLRSRSCNSGRQPASHPPGQGAGCFYVLFPGVVRNEGNSEIHNRSTHAG